MNFENYIIIILAITLNGFAGLAGGLIPSSTIHTHLSKLLACAAGVLLATAFLDLLPHAFEFNQLSLVPGQLLHGEVLFAANQHFSITTIFTACLIGFFAFYLIEMLFGSHATGQQGHRHDHVGPLILLGDALHNITDGLAITAAFMVNTPTGIATTATVLLHELPQEIADFTILISKGWTRKKALFWLFLVQLSAFLGMAAGLTLASEKFHFSPLVLSFSAGGFIYIAAADLLPGLHRISSHHSEDDDCLHEKITRVVFMGIGIGIILLFHCFFSE